LIIVLGVVIIKNNNITMGINKRIKYGFKNKTRRIDFVGECGDTCLYNRKLQSNAIKKLNFYNKQGKSYVPDTS
jgi:hypothetical protein